LKPDNVAILRLYLNDRMVDLKKPVTVFVNKKVKFEGLIKASVEEMLADQLYLGRGWRYYSAVIDVDLAEAPATRPAAPTPAKPINPSTAPRK